MLPDRVSNPGPLTYESDALPIALRGPARMRRKKTTMTIIKQTVWTKFVYFRSLCFASFQVCNISCICQTKHIISEMVV